jgi:hypothetical protein
MGYNVNLIGSNFVIPKDRLEDAFEAMKALNQRDDLKGGGAYGPLPDGTYGTIEKFFSWMPADYDKTMTSAAQILKELGFDLSERDDGSISIEGYDSKIGDENHFIEAIAPFVEDGSYLEWEGEDGAHWRILVREGRAVAQTGHIEYTD